MDIARIRERRRLRRMTKAELIDYHERTVHLLMEQWRRWEAQAGESASAAVDLATQLRAAKHGAKP